MTARNGSGGKTSGCPICGKPSDPGHRPFCSKRCADVDLHRWLGEGYRIPTEEPPADGLTGDGDDEPQH